MPRAKTMPPMKEVVDQWLGRGGCGSGAAVVLGAAVELVVVVLRKQK